MTAALLEALAAAGGRVSLRGERLVIAAPVGAVAPELIERLRAAKPAVIVHLRSLCAHCGGQESPGRPLLPVGTTAAGHAWLHDGCYPRWLAAHRAGGTPRRGR